MSVPTTSSPSAYYRIDPLKADNWLQWKRRTQAVMRDRKLLEYIDGTLTKPPITNPASPDATEKTKYDAWAAKDGQAQTQIELSIGDAEMIHILGATTAKEMWDQLCGVKEPRGALGVLGARRKFYRMSMEEGAEMVSHIAELRQLQNDLHVMGSVVADEDFMAVMVTSLPESWDAFTQAYFGATGGVSGKDKKTPITSHELGAVLIDEDRRRRERGGGDNALFAKGRQPTNRGNGDRRSDRDTRPSTGTKCFNCNKIGHMKSDCWAKGGGKEGQGPRSGRRRHDRANRADDASPQDANEWKDLSYATREVDSDIVCRIAENDKVLWFADTAATSHLATEISMFTSYRATPNGAVTGVGGNTPVCGRGTVELTCIVNGEKITNVLEDVMHVPSAQSCLLSIGRLDDAGGSMEVRKGECRLRNKKGAIIAEGRKAGRMYLMDAKVAIEKANAVADTDAVTWDELHRRFAHTGISGLEGMVNSKAVTGISIRSDSHPTLNCEACIKAKLARRRFPQEKEHGATRKGELTHTDLWGPAPKASIGKSNYYISFTDDFTRFATVDFLHTKDQAIDKVKNYVAMVEKQLETIVKSIRSDKGGEFTSGDMKAWAASKGIELQNTAPYSPQQNGVAERRNRTWLELARAILLEKDLPTYLWAEAVKHVVYVRNMVPDRTGVTPYERWTGTKPDVSHLREWGCDVWIKVEIKQKKLDARANRHVFVGFEDGPKAIRYYKRSTRQVLVSRNFKWAGEEPQQPSEMWLPLEGEIGGSASGQLSTATPAITVTAPIAPAITSPTTIAATIPLPISPPMTPPPKPGPSTGLTPAFNRFSLSDQAGTEATAPQGVSTTSDPAPTPPPRKLTRMEKELQDMTIQPPRQGKRTARGSKSGRDTRDTIKAAIEEHAFLTVEGPKTLSAALDTNEADAWRQAAQEEIDQLHQHGTWKLQDLPPGRKAIGTRWVLTKKHDSTGKLERYKARLVAQGFSQIPGVDFSNTYAPTLRLDSQRAVIALAAVNNLVLRQFDIKGAYLNGVLEEEIYMRQPEGFDDGSGRVCRLYKTIYGLRQSGREWNKEWDRSIKTVGFARTHSDPCVYTRTIADHLSILTVWVDDVLAATKTENDMLQIEGELGTLFDIKNLGEPRHLLGIEINRDPSCRLISLRQTGYIDAMLAKYGLTDANPVHTPIDTNVDLRSRTGNPVDPHDYIQIIGSLLYAAMCTRPDIAYAVQALSQFSQDPGSEHMTAAKRVLRYLKGTKDLALTYGGPGQWDNLLDSYTDADWASNEDRKSISGFVFLLAGGAISWSAKKQPIVALSSTESEYIASTHAARHLIWLRSLLAELGFDQPTASALYIDNQSAMSLALDDQFHNRTKHIDIRFHFIREQVHAGTTTLIYCPTEEMVADVMTKGLARPLHEKHRLDLGIMPA